MPRRRSPSRRRANLSEVFQTIGAEFQAATGIHPVFSFGSTAQLMQQIENGAPFDVFAAADSSHVDQLEREEKLAPGSEAVYATGILALWIPPSSHAKINSVADLTSSECARHRCRAAGTGALWRGGG